MNLKEISLLRNIVYRLRNCRDRHSFSSGRGNRISKRGAVKVNSRIQIRGNRNVVILERGCVLKNALIRVQGDENVIILRKNAFVSGAELWVEDNGCHLEIGEKTFVGHHSHLACTENGSRLSVGSNCMISSYVQIRTGDSHSIMDGEGNRLNPAQSVVVGNRVWIGEGARLLKGASLNEDTIVATGSIVTKEFTQKRILIGGVPADVIKEDVIWDSERR
jgi:acetyltransferase-like isoleucine patch superfamily enzyme